MVVLVVQFRLVSLFPWARFQVGGGKPG
jgi:hypothetical protein